ncbi:MAG: vitamin K epoxide reductase family protein [Desulfobacterales bacterium]
MKKGRHIVPLPFPVYFFTVISLTLLGLAVSSYLSISHYRVHTDVAYSSFCAISYAINCDTVSQSAYSIFMGLPIPVWGIIGYTFFLLLLVPTWSERSTKARIWTLLFLISLAFSLYSIILAFVSTFYIHTYCILCILTYAINLMLLFYTWLIRKRFNTEKIGAGIKKDILFLLSKKIERIALFTPFVIGVLSVIIFYPAYWNLTPPPLSPDIPKGIGADGHPWIGAKNPKLVITEFADYQCFQCNKMHFYLRHLIEKYPDKIRLIHRHFPLDHRFNPIVKAPLHVRAGSLAMLAIYAAQRGKFWEMNDLLFDIARQPEGIELEFIAQKVGLPHADLLNALKDRDIVKKLVLEIRQALKMGIGGTPAFLINQKVYLGQIPPDIIKKALR